MTIVAWDGKTLAADKQAGYGNGVRVVTKIFKHGDRLFGLAGDGGLAQEVMAWVLAGANPDKYPAAQRDKDNFTNVLVISKYKVIEYARSPIPTLYEDIFLATGCGRDFAIAAMYLGKTAKEAVEIACRFDSACGMGVDTLTLD